MSEVKWGGDAADPMRDLQRIAEDIASNTGVDTEEIRRQMQREYLLMLRLMGPRLTLSMLRDILSDIIGLWGDLPVHGSFKNVADASFLIHISVDEVPK